MKPCDASVWRDTVLDAVAEGWSEFVTLMALDGDDVQLWLRLRNSVGGDRVLVVSCAEPVPSIADVLPAASWPEREANDLFGVVFQVSGMRPLLRSGDDAPMRKARLLPARQSTPWPGEKEPGGVAARRRLLPPGVVGERQ